MEICLKCQVIKALVRLKCHFRKDNQLSSYSGYSPSETSTSLASKKKKILALRVTRSSLPFSQQLANFPHPEPDKSSSAPPNLCTLDPIQRRSLILRKTEKSVSWEQERVSWCDKTRTVL